MCKGRTLIIAEAGVNHNGSLELAKKLADYAKKAGADIVKFQTFSPSLLVSKIAKMAEYQIENTGKEESQLEMLKSLSLQDEEYFKLNEYCKGIGMIFLSTPFDKRSIKLLKNIDMPYWKIPSGEITNIPYLIEIAKTGKPIILSTGMCDMGEIEFAVSVLKENGASEISLLHCNTEYPTPYEDVNLNAMLAIKEKFGCKVGYSDHTKGIEVPIAAVAMGAEIIEKHFTLDKNMEGPDHKASLEPDELAEMVHAIRNIEKAKGSFEKRPSNSEIKNRDIARKSIVAAKSIKKGELFTEDNITVKRPGNGISPTRWFDILGKIAEYDFEEDELIRM